MRLRVASSLVFTIARRRCSQAAASTFGDQLPESFRTLENDPRNHTLDHEGKFYTIDLETWKNVFKYGGFSQHYREQLEILNETALMVRKPALEVIHYLKNADYSLPPIRYVLYSKSVGTGMTLTMAHIIHYAWMNKWIIVHCNRPYSWIRTTHPKYLQPSTYNPIRVDQNREAVAFLQHFKQQNFNLIDQIKLSKSYTWSKREVSEEGDTLTSVIEHGLERVPHATDCVNVILKEIKAQSGPNSFRTLVAVDGVNALFGDFKRRRPDATLIKLDELSLIRSFKKLLSNDWSNAAIVTSADNFADCTLPEPKQKPVKVLWPDKNPQVHTPVDPYAPIVKEHVCYPRALLRTEGFSKMEPFVPVEVPKYSLKEFNSCFNYYSHLKYIQSEEGRSEDGRQELRFLSGSIPGDLMRFCATI